jgi:hypothetical protein
MPVRSQTFTPTVFLRILLHKDTTLAVRMRISYIIVEEMELLLENNHSLLAVLISCWYLASAISILDLTDLNACI